jgi:hypothetical protein
MEPAVVESASHRLPLVNRLRRRRPYVVLAVGGITLLSTAGVALGLWAASGSGSGGAGALTAQSITVNAVPSPTADLFPGSSGALQFELSNPNPYPVNLTSVVYGAVTSSDQANCAASYLTTATDGALASLIGLTAAAIDTPASIPAAVTLAANAPDGCQGVTFTVAVTLTGAQV